MYGRSTCPRSAPHPDGGPAAAVMSCRRARVGAPSSSTWSGPARWRPVEPSTRAALRDAVARVRRREAGRAAARLRRDAGAVRATRSWPRRTTSCSRAGPACPRKNTTVDLVSGRRHETIERCSARSRWVCTRSTGLAPATGGSGRGPTWRPALGEPVLRHPSRPSPTDPGALVRRRRPGSPGTTAPPTRSTRRPVPRADGSPLGPAQQRAGGDPAGRQGGGDPAHGVHKGRAVARALEAPPRARSSSRWATTDRRGSLRGPAGGSIAVKVGAAESRAQLAVPNVAAARALLAEIARG